MRFAYSEDQAELAATARRLLSRPRGAVAWSEVVALGWPALAVPERHGGLGLDWIWVAALMEEAGRALQPLPLLSTVALGANLLAAAGTEAQAARWLPAIAEGAIATFASGGEVHAVRTAGGYALTGAHRRVLDGAAAALVVVEATLEGRPALFLAEPGPGLAVEESASLDPTRPLATLRFEGLVLGEDRRLPGAPEPALDRARVALAAEMVGGAERCLELAVDYAKLRTQFGRPIGAFQAIKHKCADMLLGVESARSAAMYAAWCAAEAPSELPLAAAAAKAYAGEAFFTCAAECLQIHGGLGFTWEHDTHLYLKRAKTMASFLGTPGVHREAIAKAIGL